MNLYAFLWQGYSATLIQGVNNVLAAALLSVAAVVQGALVIYVIITGILVLLGVSMPMSVVIRRLIRAVIISAILTPVYFNQFIRDMFITTLPNWIAQSVGGPPTENAVQQFGLLNDAVVHSAAAIKAQATGIFYIASSLEIAICTALIQIAIMACFIIWFVANVMISLLVCVGPFVLVGYLFDGTKHVADRWIGKMIGQLILLLLVAVVMQIVITQDTAYMRQAVATGAGIAEQIAAMWNVFITFAVGAGLLMLLPAIAAYIGGGISFSPVAFFSVATAFPARLGNVVRGR